MVFIRNPYNNRNSLINLVVELNFTKKKLYNNNEILNRVATSMTRIKKKNVESLY